MKKLLFKVSMILLVVTVFNSCNESLNSPVDTNDLPQKSGLIIAAEKVQNVMTLQDKVTHGLFENPEVVGTGTGLDETGKPAIVVFTLNKVEQRADVNMQNIGQGAHPTALPFTIENVKVIPKVTGMFKIYADPTARFPRPVPIGVSTGHPDITAGTIGCRVTDGTNVFALSNNHVYANENKASLGDNELQPGPYDGGINPDDAIGTLYDFEPIDFSGENEIDAAIALCSPENLGYATPFGDGYGAPSSTTDTPSLNMKVQKYGRTTGWTHGNIAEINVTVEICYETHGPFKCSKSAVFVNQFTITPGSFSGGGDSGSLIVSDDGNNKPVGLLFAGSSTRTIANPINAVLDRFGVTIDDGSFTGGGTTNVPPKADFTYSVDLLNVSFTDASSDKDGTISSRNWDFGDGNTSTNLNPSHTYSASGNYNVMLTVTDNDGASSSVTKTVSVSDQVPTGITLTANGYKVKGLQKVDLTWSGATGVDIYRDGNSIVTNVSGSSFTDNIDNRGGGSYTYHVCETGSTSTCSADVTVTF